ncbi:uncharacterized protein [Epargyreus clarus]|uniref:uncharacterized protein n=1 Tax=Epargyreus clarus TaxID=520877 RepID=UPI003C2F109E
MKSLLLLCILQYAASLPMTTLEDLEIADDTWSVGSYVREVRAAAPDDYHKSYQSEGDGEVGYSRKKSGGGKKGYQHFDSYHKKAGDNYAFEKEDSYGQEHEGQQGAHSHKQERRAKEEPEAEYEEEEEHEEKGKNKEKKKHRHYEELKEGASDGNGGVEAHGHDIRDYTLPEKYTWGEGDEDFNF